MNDTKDAPGKFASTDYPTIDLANAVERAQQLYKKDRKNAVSPEVLAEHWGYKAKSSGLGLTASALKKYGLLTKATVGQVKLTELALRIVLDEDENSADRLAAIREAAILPDLYQTLWRKYGAELPSDTSFKKMLVMEMNFHDKIAVDIMNKYRRTLAFAKLDQDGGGTTASGRLEATAPAPPPVGASNGAVAHVQRKPAPGAREFRLTMGQGEALISVPPGSTAEDVDMLIETLTLWKKRMVSTEEN